MDNDFFRKINMQYAYDFLTKTLNKEAILGYAEYLVEQKKPFALFFLDLDHYKSINDTLGHQVGDIVLARTAKQIMEDLAEVGIVGRFGGDEFICIVEDIINYDEIWQLARKVSQGIRFLKINELKDKLWIASLTSTIGVARYPLDAVSFNELLEASDKALYRGKHKGRNCFIIYNDILHSSIKKSQEGKQYTSEQLLNYIYEELSGCGKNILAGMKRLLGFFYDYFNIEGITLVENEKVLETYANGKFSQYDVIHKEYYDLVGLSHDGMVILNNRNHLTEISQELYESFLQQNVRATMIFDCKTSRSSHGYLRIDMARERVWTYEERIIFLTLARTYAIYKELRIK